MREPTPAKAAAGSGIGPAWIWAAVLLALFTAGGSFVLQHRTQQRQAWAALEVESRPLALRLNWSVQEGLLAGGLALMGTVGEPVKAGVAPVPGGSGTPPPVPAALRSLLADRAQTLGVDGLQLFDRQGLLRARWDSLGEAGTTNGTGTISASISATTSATISATTGLALVDAVARAAATGGQGLQLRVLADTASLEPAVLLAGPVWRGRQQRPGDEAEVIGAVVARLEAANLRRLIAQPGRRTALISPQGRVMAATAAAQAVARERIDAEARLPAGLHEAGSLLDGLGARRAVVRLPLSWQGTDPAAPNAAPATGWTLLVVHDLPPIRSQFPHAGAPMGLGAAAGALVLLLGLMARTRREQQDARAALAAQTAAEAARLRRQAKLADIGLLLQAAPDGPALAQAFLRAAHEALGTAQGCLYRRADADSDALELVAAWACEAPPPQTFRLGEGLVGQVAADGQPVVMAPADLAELPELPVRLRSGLGQAAPRSVLLLPLLHQGRSLGVVELAWPAAVDADTLAHAQALGELLALNLRLMTARADPAAARSAPPPTPDRSTPS